MPLYTQVRLLISVRVVEKSRYADRRHCSASTPTPTGSKHGLAAVTACAHTAMSRGRVRLVGTYKRPDRGGASAARKHGDFDTRHGGTVASARHVISIGFTTDGR